MVPLSILLVQSRFAPVVLASRLLLPNLDLLRHDSNRPLTRNPPSGRDPGDATEAAAHRVDERFEYLPGRAGLRQATFGVDGSMQVALMDDDGKQIGAFVMRRRGERGDFTMDAVDRHGNEDCCDIAFAESDGAAMSMVLAWESGELIGCSSTRKDRGSSGEDVVWNVATMDAQRSIVDVGRITIDHDTGDASWSEEEDGDGDGKDCTRAVLGLLQTPVVMGRFRRLEIARPAADVRDRHRHGKPTHELQRRRQPGDRRHGRAAREWGAERLAGGELDSTHG